MSDELHVSPHNRPILKTLLQSLAFGIAFLLLTAALLWSLALYSLWRDGTGILHLYYQGGFPCIGIFAITSAAYFISKLVPYRFMTALIIMATATILIDFIAHAFDLFPQLQKGIEVQWQRPAILFWLIVPPWLVAGGIVGCRRFSYRKQQSPT